MTTEKFIKNDIHYIKEILNNGAINIYPDPEFQPAPKIITEPEKPPLPNLSTTDKKLDFIIRELGLKNKYIT